MHTFAEAHRLGLGGEAAVLGKLPTVAAGFVLSAEYEELFYRSNNLPARLSTLFSGIQPRRLDEDVLEQLCTQAEKMMIESSLMDNSIAQLFLAFKNAGLLGQSVIIRREYQAEPLVPYQQTALDTPNKALFALKKLWASDWSFDAVRERFDQFGRCALDARPTIFICGQQPQTNPDLAQQLAVKQVWQDREQIVGVLV